MRQAAVALCAVALAGLLAGCGGDSRYASPRATFETMAAAARAGDKEAMVACFDKETKGYFGELEKLGAEMKGAKKSPNGKFTSKLKDATIEYGKEEITDETAALAVTMNGKPESIKFRKEEGAWKVSIPELKMAVAMMKGLPNMMEGMMKGLADPSKKGMKGAAEGMAELMKGMKEK